MPWAELLSGNSHDGGDQPARTLAVILLLRFLIYSQSGKPDLNSQIWLANWV